MGLILFILAVSPLLAISGYAQTAPAVPATAQAPGSSTTQPEKGFGSVEGTVTDTSGAAVVGANVTVRNAAGVTLSGITDGSGKFRITGVSAGTQDVIVTQPTFAESKTEGVTVTAGDTADVEVQLQPVTTQSTVTVMANKAAQIE